MYTLLSGLYDWATSREEVRLLMIGLDGAGKTSLMHALVAAASATPSTAPTPSTRPTVGLNVGRLDVGGASVMLWDLGGAAGLRVIWERYYRDAHGLIFVVDAADRGRWEEARAALEAAVAHPDLAGAPLLVVAHKADAVDGSGSGGGGTKGAPGVADDIATALGPAAADGPPGGPGGLVVAAAARPAGGGAALAHALAWLVERARRGGRAAALRERGTPA